MNFRPLPLEGAYTIDLEPIVDDRGFNARSWCAQTFREKGLDPSVVQTNIIFNKVQGTLRGFHFQAPPFTETKLFRVTRGGIYDVIIDLRPDSPTYRQWTGVELWASDYRLLYVPEGFAQAFQTLVDDTELTYQVSQPYSPQHGRGLRHDDPAFAVTWPLPVAAISQQDRRWPDWEAS